MSGVTIANPFGPPTPPTPMAVPPNPFVVQPAPYGVPAFQVPPAADPYAQLAQQTQQDPNIIDAQFTVVPPPQPVLAPGMPPSAPTTLGPDAGKTEADLTEEYIGLRDAKKAMAERHANELAPISDRMGAIEQTMLARLDASGVQSLRTTMGTVFKKLTTRYSVGDPDKLFSWVEANGQLDMLARSIKQDAVRSYFEETGTLPPGVEVFSQFGVQFRK